MVAAAQQIRRTLRSDRSARPSQAEPHLDPAVRDLAVNGIRAWGLTQVRLKRLTTHSPPLVIQALLAITFSCIGRQYRPIPIIVDQAVKASEYLGGNPSVRFTNAVLRKFMVNESSALEDEKSPEAKFNAPVWFIEKLKRAGQQVLHAFGETAHYHPPLTLRFIGGQGQKEKWQAAMQRQGFGLSWQTESAVIVYPPRDVKTLPGYSQGLFRVQDLSAQAAFNLLPLKPGDCVLDACAAPGGKTFLLAEQEKIKIWAIDLSEKRLDRLENEKRRLLRQWPGREIYCRVTDLLEEPWPADIPPQFDHILLDAPCSGSGVIRRHPEIPWRRSEHQLTLLVETQARLLELLWKKLNVSGQLLYVTCSVFFEEGEEQIQRFIDRHENVLRLSAPGLILPYQTYTPASIASGDGFFYARLQKI